MSDKTTPGPDLWAKLQWLTSDARWGDLLAAQIRDLIEPELDRRDAEIADLKAQQLTEATAARKNIRRWAEQVKAAEAERDRLDVRMEEIVEGFKNAHSCHRTDQSGTLCTTCHTRYPCPTARALDAIGDQASDVVAERDQLRRALESIGTRCEVFTGTGPVKTCVDDPRRSRDAENRLAFGWCDGCIARTALDRSDLPAVREFVAEHDPRKEAT